MNDWYIMQIFVDYRYILYFQDIGGRYDEITIVY